MVFLGLNQFESGTDQNCIHELGTCQLNHIHGRRRDLQIEPAAMAGRKACLNVPCGMQRIIFFGLQGADLM